jgi:leucyl aminopeptidase (aminopeptidase T)
MTAVRGGGRRRRRESVWDVDVGYVIHGDHGVQHADALPNGRSSSAATVARGDDLPAGEAFIAPIETSGEGSIVSTKRSQDTDCCTNRSG